MRALLWVALLACSSTVVAQALWLESGLSYVETAPQQYEAGVSFGVRGLLPLGETANLFLHPFWRSGLGLDAGVLARFPVDLEDPEGFRAYLGGGLSLIRGRFGLALVAAISYELSPQTELALVYSHRPLLTPELAQAFDISLAYVFRFD